jgi:uncharacterized protein involved in exopolysaccharide biosynthesis
MGPTSSAPPGGAGRPPVRQPGPPPGQLPPVLGPGYLPPPPSSPPLSSAQQSKIALVCVLAVVAGALLGLLATVVLPHVYAAQTTIRYSVGEGGSDAADRALTTQTVIITSREVLDPVAKSTGIPVDYLVRNTTAVVVPNSEIIQVQVKHSDRAAGIRLADAVAKQYIEIAAAHSPRAAVQTELDGLQHQLNSATTPAASLPELRVRITALQNELDNLATRTNLASIAAPAYSLPDPVFPNTLITVGIGALVGIVAAAWIGSSMARRFRG